jgi:Ricin-type beta-trefoil lectin domain-like
MSNRHPIAAALTVVAAIAAIMLVDAQVAHAVGPNKITNWGSGLCLDVGHYGNLNDNGVRIQQWGCSGESRQVWNFIVTANPDTLKLGYKISNAGSGKCLDVENGKNADRTPVQQWECRTGQFAASQTWYVDPAVPTRIVSDIGGRCLDVAGGSLVEGAYLQTYHCTANNAAQIFVLK